VQLLAASKFQSASAIRAAHALGQRDFGENYVQELAHKAEQLADLADLRWHLIGRLQTNKVKDVLRIGCRVQALDSLKLCEALAMRAEQAGSHGVEVFVQVNISAEPQKAGVSEAELSPLIAAVRQRPVLKLRGLMSIPEPSDDERVTRSAFRRVRELADSFQLAECSMGMSEDLEIAIEEGATMVRVGTAIFGERPSR
jgi:pyridoxal phosphate enzyme (YggS family)